MQGGRMKKNAEKKRNGMEKAKSNGISKKFKKKRRKQKIEEYERQKQNCKIRRRTEMRYVREQIKSSLIIKLKEDKTTEKNHSNKKCAITV